MERKTYVRAWGKVTGNPKCGISAHFAKPTRFIAQEMAIAEELPGSGAVMTPNTYVFRDAFSY